MLPHGKLFGHQLSSVVRGEQVGQKNGIGGTVRYYMMYIVNQMNAFLRLVNIDSVKRSAVHYERFGIIALYLFHFRLRYGMSAYNGLFRC